MTVRSSLSRTVTFFALHHLHRADWSEARNLEAFGALGDPAGHGHDYACTVRVSGPLVHGMVMDLAELDRLLDLVVRAPLAGRHLNLDVPEFGRDGTMPTCEAIAEYVYRRLLPRLPAELSLDFVRIAEDATLAGEAGSA
jgi:6-pyruvoyltetrahydropterin/6-carboxytetrahydropterin synthase